MKKIFLLLFGLFVVCFLFFGSKDEEIRIRVISNSDNETDIKYKKEVVNYLKEEILPYIILNDEYLSSNYKSIENVLNEKFQNINVKYEKHTFNNKTYNDSAIKDGVYKTLVIYIGEGKGSNWWGSIFNEKLFYESEDEVVYKWYFKNE